MKKFSKRQWKWLLMIGLGILVVIVILQNTETVQTKVLWVRFEMPRVVLLFITLAVGFLLGMFGARYFRRL